MSEGVSLWHISNYIEAYLLISTYTVSPKVLKYYDIKATIAQNKKKDFTPVYKQFLKWYK